MCCLMWNVNAPPATPVDNPHCSPFNLAAKKSSNNSLWMLEDLKVNMSNNCHACMSFVSFNSTR